MKLIEMLDELLDLMERDPSYAQFMLDGQMAVIDDYLEIRPENEGRIRALAQSGRLSMGPWYILMDEFLVSGETIIRDLQRGIQRGADFGGVMEVGYLPDMFGHIAQMPQILTLAGFHDTVLWRGVPSSITRTGFEWAAPNGSTVRAEFLPVGYGNGASLPSDPAQLLRRIQDHVDEIGSLLFDDLLFMNGSDHLRPQPFLGATVAQANALQDDLVLEITSLPDYLSRAPREGLDRWNGELRSGSRSNILMGVTSNRVDVKRAVAITERTLERRAEPLSSFYLAADSYPERLLDAAWLEMIRNSAHDSICACSVDEVVDAVLHRYAEARQIADGVVERALVTLATSLSSPGLTVVNNAARSRSGLVETVVSGDELDETLVQVLSERMGLPGSIVLDATTVKTVLGMLQGPKIDNDLWVHHVTVAEDDEGIHLTISLGAEENPHVNMGQAKGDLYTKLGARPEASVFVSLDQPRIRRVLARVADVPGFGWAPFTPAPVRHAAHGETVEGKVILRNRLLQVEIDPTDGTFALNGQPGFGRLVDMGDLGDSYNYSPPAHDATVEEPFSVTVTMDESGPLRASATIVARYEWPDHVDGGSQRREGSHEVEVTTRLLVHADETTLRVETSFVNPARDHRLRVHFPLPSPATTSEAECSFAIVERGLEAEGRPDEFGLPTFPSRRFVRSGGLTIIHEGLNEYELVDIVDGKAREIAVTLLRSTGMLSRLGMTNRPLPAGPLTAVEGLQLVGSRIVSRYALHVGELDPYDLAEDVLLPLEIIPTLGGGTRPPRGTSLDLRGAQISSIRRVDGALEVRVFNPSSESRTLEIQGRRGSVLDLRGNLVDTFAGLRQLAPHEILSLRLEEPEMAS